MYSKQGFQGSLLRMGPRPMFQSGHGGRGNHQLPSSRGIAEQLESNTTFMLHR